ncbi:HCL214Wp [Eremothecium sinecaudum]|uniref:HCL214Wp n=1 Tax=Eremothecium sinecaudum TaxID=45286 RepID=A0A109UWL0_9SACH|nr:HCL214Wp [Eremothecium sinecaudum]AMD19937.1 HCL214Wp [Eremothecium sinecaudum]
MDVTTEASTTPSIYITEAQQRRQSAGGHQSHQLQHHLGAQHQHQMAKYRRDSIAHSQGIGGVSWGSLTVGSWLKEEVMNHAHMKDPTNGNITPNNMVALSSPPSSSGSYLPNLEKQYCKDYSCCGQLLPGLHDLLRHYEEAHIATSPWHLSIVEGSGNPVGNVAAASGLQHGAAAGRKKMPGIQQQHGQQQGQQHHSGNGVQNSQNSAMHHSENSQHSQNHHHIQQQFHSNNIRHLQLQHQVQIPNHHPAITASTQMQHQPNLQSVQQLLHLSGNLVDAVSTNEVFLQNNKVAGNGTVTMTSTVGGDLSAQNGAKLDMNSAGKRTAVIQPRGNRKQQPSQQVNFSNYSLQMNSANSTNMGNLQNSGQSRLTEKRQAMGSAAAGIDLDFMDQDVIDEFHQDGPSTLMAMQHMGLLVDGSSVGRNGTMHSQPGTNLASMMKKKNGRTINNGSAGSSNVLSNKRSANGSITPGGRHNMSSDDEDDEDDDEDQDEDVDENEPNGMSRKQQGYIDDPARRLYIMGHEEHKPFKCPVIGCDKTYKNQNGLKYHKTHGHQNQKLHENPDGTFSIIDPESNEPYPDGMGFEKDKPYRCEVCGKRYKNLNGLKYHRGHSTH